jgi:hypothetical protein
VDRQGEVTVCVFKSRLDFNSFTVTGIAVLDRIVEDSVKADIHQSLDSTVADRLNQLENGTPLPGGASARCGDWRQL